VERICDSNHRAAERVPRARLVVCITALRAVPTRIVANNMGCLCRPVLLRQIFLDGAIAARLAVTVIQRRDLIS
jgi:hypothetical protein